MRHVKINSGVMLAALVFHNDGEPVGDFRKAWATASVAAGLGKFVCSACSRTVDGHRCSECKAETSYSGRLYETWSGRVSLSA